jgi:NAD(P)-dependent dehydrogenase (short-subunit alcohol dehydrogenase family)
MNCPKKAVLATGSTSGIGEACARMFADGGAAHPPVRAPVFAACAGARGGSRCASPAGALPRS